MKYAKGAIIETLLLILIPTLILGILIQTRQALGIAAENLIEPSWLVIILVPLVIWLIASGRLVEFTAGSISAKLIQTSKEQVTPKSFGESEVALHSYTEVQSGSRPELEDAAAKDPVFLTLELGNEEYSDDEILVWVNRLIKSPSFRYIAFKSPTGRLSAYISANALLSYLSETSFAYSTRASVAKSIELRNIPRIPQTRIDWLETTVTNKQALEYLNKKSCDDVAIVDQQGKLIGLLTRTDILNTFISSLVLSEKK